MTSSSGPGAWPSRRQAPLDAQDGVAQVGAAADAVRPGPLVERAQQVDGAHALAVDRHGQALLEAEDQLLRLTLGGRRVGRHRVDGLRRHLPRVVGLLAADRGAEEPDVDRVVDGLRVDVDGAFGEPGALLGARPVEVADGRVDGQLRSQGADGDVEADLVVARARRAMADGRGADIACHAHDRLGLGGALGTDRDGVHPTA